MDWRDFPGAPEPGEALLNSAGVQEGEVRAVKLGAKPALFRAVVLRIDGVARAYVNLCPHFRVPLALEGREFTTSPGYLWCAFHSAQYRQHDGYCVDGPVRGARLIPIPVTEEKGTIRIAEGRRDYVSDDVGEPTL